ncbi:lasso peptide biosynthesis B2 protein [Silicimonas algicola]|uniref:lasso peptide biosynthesis B2 protein n=1 Tax=Silicimonas algicola TaxID=1826607 RepID=UPI0019D1F079|nr:lasso peptide biosynthesis B2 protein [Silicimonas algicola]
MRLAGKLSKATRLSGDERRALSQAAAALLRARLVLGRLPARRLVEQLQADEAATSDDTLDPVILARLKLLEWAVRTAANNLPWRTDCLVRCLAAQAMLRREDLGSRFFLGVRKTEDGDLAAHAWLRCHGVTVAGGEGEGFEVLLRAEGGSLEGSHADRE